MTDDEQRRDRFGRTATVETAPPNTLVEWGRYVALRTPFEYVSRSADSSPREPISEMSVRGFGMCDV